MATLKERLEEAKFSLFPEDNRKKIYGNLPKNEKMGEKLKDFGEKIAINARVNRNSGNQEEHWTDAGVKPETLAQKINKTSQKVADKVNPLTMPAGQKESQEKDFVEKAEAESKATEQAARDTHSTTVDQASRSAEMDDAAFAKVKDRIKKEKSSGETQVAGSTGSSGSSWWDAIKGTGSKVGEYAGNVGGRIVGSMKDHPVHWGAGAAGLAAGIGALALAKKLRKKKKEAEGKETN
jgi:hypothetical protein